MRDGDGCGATENNKHDLSLGQVQRHRREVVGDRIVRRLNFAGVGMPQFGFLSGHAEAGLDVLRPIRAIGDEVEVGIIRTAMNPGDIGIQRPGEFRVLGEA